MSKQDAAYLRKAAQKIHKEGWTQKPVNFWSGPTCIGLAIDSALPADYPWRGPVHAAVEFVVGTNEVVEWNDAPGRTKEEVLEVLKVAARIARDL